MQFKDIFKDLITFPSFSTYLIEAPFQTTQMVNKQTLVLKSREDQEIISINKSMCSYVDEDYFSNTMRENTMNKSY